MQFASDNAGPAHPAVMDAIRAANTGFAMAYGTDDLTKATRDRVRAVFEAPEADVVFLTSGTAANAIALSNFAQPWQTIFAAPTAHIAEDEGGAVELMTHGGKITEVPGKDGKIDAGALATTLARFGGTDPHTLAAGPVSLTQATEKGTLYKIDEIAHLAGLAHDAGVALHMDGARLANAVAALEATPAEITRKAGVDVLSLGATKNGCLAAEAIVIFDPARATDIPRRAMRAGHLPSKQRYIAAQFLAWFEDDLWLDLAARANSAAARLARGLKQTPDIQLLYEPAANILFVEMPRSRHVELMKKGAVYHLWEDADANHVTARLVCDWSKTESEIDAFLALL